MDANLQQEPGKDKRYLVTVSYYAYSPDDESVKRDSVSWTSKLNQRFDCNASVDEILEAPFAEKAGRKVL